MIARPPVCHSIFSLLIALCLAAQPAAAADKLDEWIKLLPESGLIVATVKSFPDLGSKWEKTSFAKFWADESIQKWTAPMRAEGGFIHKMNEDGDGRTFAESIEPYCGAGLAVFGVSSVDDFDGDHPPFACISETKHQAGEFAEYKLKEMESRKKQHPNWKQRDEAIGGVTVHVFAKSEDADSAWIDCWALLDDGIVIEGSSRPLVEHFITALQSGSADKPSPDAGPHLARITELAEGSPDVLVYVSGSQGMKLIDQAVEKSAAKNKGPMPMPFQPKDLLNAFGLGEIQGLAIAVDLSEETAKADFVLLHPEKPAGLVAMMRGTGVLESYPDFIPPAIGAGSVARQSFAAIYDGLLQMLQKLGPMLGGMVTMQIAEFEKNAGLSLKNDLFGSLADETVSLEEYPRKADAAAPGEAKSQVMGFKLKDRARFAAALDTLKKFAGSGFAIFEDSDYLGFKLNVLKASMLAGGGQPGAKVPDVAYCITDEYFLLSIGDGGLLRKTLGRMKEKNGGSLWDESSTQALIGRLPKGFSGVSIVNGGSFAKFLASTFSSIQEMGGKAAPAPDGGKGPKGPKAKKAAKGGGKQGIFDPAAAPDDKIFARYFGPGAVASYSHPDAVHVRFITEKPEAAQ